MNKQVIQILAQVSFFPLFSFLPREILCLLVALLGRRALLQGSGLVLLASAPASDLTAGGGWSQALLSEPRWSVTVVLGIQTRPHLGSQQQCRAAQAVGDSQRTAGLTITSSPGWGLPSPCGEIILHGHFCASWSTARTLWVLQEHFQSVCELTCLSRQWSCSPPRSKEQPPASC